MKRIVPVLVFSLLALSCSGGGGGESTTIPTTISTIKSVKGAISAPGGTIGKPTVSFAKWIASFFVSESIAQGTPTLAPVPNATVAVLRINPTTGAVTETLGTTTTGADGSYSLNLPSGVDYSPTLLVRAVPPGVNPATAPPNQQLNCPAVQQTLNINPAAEAATQAILARIASASLENYTNAEIAVFVGLVQTFAQDPSLVGSTIEETISKIKGKLQGLIDSTLDSIDDPGEATPPPVLQSGPATYSSIGYSAKVSGGGNILRSISTGTVTLNPDKTFTGSFSQKRVELSEGCGTSGNPCTRIFTRNITSHSETFSGTYFLSGNGKIFFTSPDDSGGTETAIGSLNPAGAVLVLQFLAEDGDGVEMGVAVQQGSGMTAADLSGTFNVTGIGADVPEGGTVNNSWPGVGSRIFFGTVNVSGSNFTFNGTDSHMDQQISCTSGTSTSGTSGCSLSATLTSNSGPENVSGTVAVAANGGLTFTVPPSGSDQGGTAPGAVSSDRNVAFVQTDDGSDGSTGFLVATRQGSGMSNASLSGAYNFVAFDEVLSGGSPSMNTGTAAGVVNFDGAGKFTLTGAETVIARDESCSGSGSCPRLSIRSKTENLSGSGTYSVNGEGTFTISGGSGADAFTFPGVISSDGSVALLRDIRDNTSCGDNCSDSARLFIIAVKQ